MASLAAACMRALVLGLSVFLLELGGLVQAAAEDGPSPACVPQGLLKLDEPFQQPGRPAMALPFCNQYGACTCCNASHAVAIHRSVAGVLADESMAHGCRRLTGQIACRLCDPLVGVGRQGALCPALCRDWYAACAEEFFEFDPFSGLLVPAAAAAQRSLVSTRLSAVVSSGEEMCALAGLQVGEDGCWPGGAPGRPPPGLCAAKPAASAAGRASGAPAEGGAFPHAWAVGAALAAGAWLASRLRGLLARGPRIQRGRRLRD
eukprot:jgi/Tetstr1/426812/TSEL_017027.t1